MMPHTGFSVLVVHMLSHKQCLSNRHCWVDFIRQKSATFNWQTEVIGKCPEAGGTPERISSISCPHIPLLITFLAVILPHCPFHPGTLSYPDGAAGDVTQSVSPFLLVVHLWGCDI